MTADEENAFRDQAALVALRCSLADPYLREFTEGTAAFCFQVANLMTRAKVLGPDELEVAVRKGLSDHTSSEGK